MAAASSSYRRRICVLLKTIHRRSKKIMAKTVCKILGLVLLLVGILGFTKVLDPLGAHLNPAHNAVHLISAAIALYFGFPGSARAARTFCLLFGVVYLLLGVCGWFLGAGADHMLNIPTTSPVLMLGKMDHIIHILLGVIFLAGGALGRSDR
ncbi:MAG: DUF4383 domain-containing protein [Acidobacteriota bacterium]